MQNINNSQIFYSFNEKGEVVATANFPTPCNSITLTISPNFIQNAVNPVSENNDEENDDIYQEKVRSLEEIQQAEHEMFDRVWYSRHKILNDENCKESPYIDGERQAILNIEKKYGKETLIVDDWTVAEWNGKLSALRWVLGDEWDFLDT